MLNRSDDLILLNEDVICVILTHVNDPTSYMHCLVLCTTTHSFLMKTHEDKIVSFKFGIIGLYKRYPDFPWDTNEFIGNPSLRIKDIIDYTPELFKEDECYRAIFSTIRDTRSTLNNLSFSEIEEIIERNINIRLCELFKRISFFDNPNITFTDRIHVPKNHIDYKLNGLNIVQLKSSGKFRYTSHILNNTNITLKFVLDNHRFDHIWYWYWESVSRNEGITIKDIIMNPQLNWNYRCVCENPNFTIKDYFNHKHLFTEYIDSVFEHAHILPEDFILYPELSSLVSSNSSICSNRSFTPDTFKKFGILVDYGYVSYNPNINMKYVIDIINNLDSFDWSYFSGTLEN